MNETELDDDRRLRAQIDPLAVELTTFGKVELATRLYMEAMREVVQQNRRPPAIVAEPPWRVLDDPTKRGGGNGEEARASKAIAATDNPTHKTKGINHDA